MKLLNDRVLVSKVEEEKTGGFETVQVQDNFVGKGRIEQTSWPEKDLPYKIGDIVLFAKYSPDTHEMKHEGVTYKIIAMSDILAVL